MKQLVVSCILCAPVERLEEEFARIFPSKAEIYCHGPQHSKRYGPEEPADILTHCFSLHHDREKKEGDHHTDTYVRVYELHGDTSFLS